MSEACPTGPGAFCGRAAARARRSGSIASLPEQEETVQWTAPNYRPPAAPLAYREKKEDGRPKGEPEPHISDAELQRTADRVYRMIEDRIRRERRRLGF